MALPVWDSWGATETSTTIIATFDVAVPTHNSGDLLLLHCMVRVNGENGTLETINTGGWTQLGGAGFMYPSGLTNNPRTGIGWKIGNGSETVVNVTTSGTGSTPLRLSRVHRFTATGGFAATPVLYHDDNGQLTINSPIVMPTVDPGGLPDRLGVCIMSFSASFSIPASTGESGGDWIEPTAEIAVTNGTIAIQTADLSGGGAISGGGFDLGTASYTAVGLTVEPAGRKFILTRPA